MPGDIGYCLPIRSLRGTYSCRCFFPPRRSETIPGCLLAAHLLDHKGNKLTYDVQSLPLGALMEWLRVRLVVHVQPVQENMMCSPWLDAESKKTPVGGVNKLVDYLYRGRLTEPDEKNDPTVLGAYAFTVFFKKTVQREFKQDFHYPRAAFAVDHPQSATYCLMRVKIPLVPILYGRIPKMPADWKGEHPDEVLVEYDDDAHNTWALYVLALFFPFSHTMTGDLDLPDGATLYERVKAWWTQSKEEGAKHPPACFIKFGYFINPATCRFPQAA